MSDTTRTDAKERYPTEGIEKRALTIPQAAAALQVSEDTVRRLLAAGQLRFVLVGTIRRIPVDAIDEFLESA